MEDQMQEDVERIFENFRSMYETCVSAAENWPDDMDQTAKFLYLVSMETSNMVHVFSDIIQEYVNEVNESSLQGKLFDD
jgi:hypothetical protein